MDHGVMAKRDCQVEPKDKVQWSGSSAENWAEKLLIWYWAVKRDLPWRNTRNPYSIWISEVMLQQTQVKTVIPYYHRFLERFPDIKALAQASLDEVYELWRGLGYYSRARHLWEGACFLLETEGGKMPGDYLSLLKIPGVGEYTAGAVASIAYGECVPVLDGNVKRVVARFLAWEERVESAKTRRHFMTHLMSWQPVEHAGDFNQAMMELGATGCTPKSPKCLECPLQEGCRGYHLGIPQAFPVKKRKEKIMEALRPTLIIRQGGKVLVKKRPDEGLLANLWEFPGEEELLLEGMKRKIHSEEWLTLYRNQVSDRLDDVLEEALLQKEIKVSGPIVHTFSHRRWRIYWIVLEVSGSTDPKEFEGLRWVDEREIGTIALPVAFQKIWEAILRQ